MSTILFVPGLREHVADHWQTLLAAEIPGSHTVTPLTEDKLSRAARVKALDRAIAQIEGPVILAAHSAGALMVVHWAQKHRHSIKGALLATPADVERPLPVGYPTPEQLLSNGWLPIPRHSLPFPTIVAGSRNDPLASFDRIAEMADAWGSHLVDAGAVGHLNPASGFGAWSQARALIEDLENSSV
jgi:hypothetical protein